LDLSVRKLARLQIRLERPEGLLGVFFARECPLGKLGEGLFLLLVLSLDPFLDTISGSLFSFFRVHDEPPLLRVSILRTVFFCSVALRKGLPCERRHGLDLRLLNPCFCF
jgi:hypothetical protein